LLVQVWEDNARVPDKEKEGLIKMLKKEKDIVKTAAEVRPITLMNVPYKIYTSIWTERFQKVLKKQIHHDQVGFMRGRIIHENTWQMKMWKNHLRDTEQLLFLDFQKAYDRVGHSYLSSVLTRMEVPPRVVAIIDNLYVNSKFWVMIEGDKSKEMTFLSGVKQGDPLSPLLFNMCLEPLLESIRGKLQDITKFGVTKKVAAYADDILVFTRNASDRNKLQKCISQYESASGGKLRPDKSLYVGEGEGLPKFSKPKTDSTYLGYLITGNSLSNQIEKMVSKLERLKSVTYPSLKGKINFLNSYGLSCLYYYMYCTKSEQKEVKLIKNIIRWYLFSKDPSFQKEKQYQSLLNKVRLEQLGLINWEAQWIALRISIFYRFYFSKNSIIGKLIEIHIKEIMERRNMDVPPFWWDIGKWSFKDNTGEINRFIKEAQMVRLTPYHKIKEGDKVWSWRENKRWFKGVVTKIEKENKEKTITVLKEDGDEIIVPKNWLIKSTKQEIWRKEPMCFKTHMGELIKIKPKEKVNNKEIRKKLIKYERKEKRIKTILDKRLSNKVTTFAVMVEWNVIKVRGNRRGNDVIETETKCQLCNKNEKEKWEHVIKCSRTKYILRNMLGAGDIPIQLRTIISHGPNLYNNYLQMWGIWRIRCKEDYEERKLSTEEMKIIWENIKEEDKFWQKMWGLKEE
jgi:hypothetical protein